MAQGVHSPHGHVADEKSPAGGQHAHHGGGEELRAHPRGGARPHHAGDRERGADPVRAREPALPFHALCLAHYVRRVAHFALQVVRGARTLNTQKTTTTSVTCVCEYSILLPLLSCELLHYGTRCRYLCFLIIIICIFKPILKKLHEHNKVPYIGKG